MKEQFLAPEIIESVYQEILREHPELQGAELSVTPRRSLPEQAAIAAKLGLPLPKDEGADLYVVTLRKDVPAEDGIIIPLSVRVTIDAQGRIVKGRQAH